MRVIATLLLAVHTLALFAQPAPEFEVASIRPHQPPLHTIMGLTISGPRITMEGYTVAMLIMEAYHLKGAWQVSFAASPGNDDQLSAYYDVVARASGDGARSRDEFRKMLQALLADRFKVSIHHDTKTIPVYLLILGKSGPKLKDGAGDSECSVHVGVVTGGQSYAFSHCAIDKLVDMLGDGLVDRPVIDRTGVTGKYDFRFFATPAFMNHDHSDLTELSPFTAIQGLGLKLQAEVAPIDIIAVDHFEKPTPN
jgi:uncharacterized protein (TIGR03435 family)